MLLQIRLAPGNVMNRKYLSDLLLLLPLTLICVSLNTTFPTSIRPIPTLLMYGRIFLIPVIRLFMSSGFNLVLLCDLCSGCEFLRHCDFINLGIILNYEIINNNI
jgi:hypothetical protein